MNKNRLNKIEKALKPDVRNLSLMAFIDDEQPDKSLYTAWNGIDGSGEKQLKKKEYEELKKQVPACNIIEIVDDIPRATGRSEN